MLRTAGGETFTRAIQHFSGVGPGLEETPRIWIHLMNPDAPLMSVAAMIDTGATWSVFGLELWERLDLPTGAPILTVSMSTRLGMYPVELHRARIGIRTDVGEQQLEIDATLGLGRSWLGPPVIGYQGFLDRLRFAVDPAAGEFHFGPIA